ncbi:MAG: hypothetical protein C6W55_00250 [Thermobacillus sp.]|nr:MAG: hypothetical protein C6W55_00250 [Thermobacillus sp.]
MPVCLYACMPVCLYACMPVCPYALMPLCPYALMPLCPYALYAPNAPDTLECPLAPLPAPIRSPGVIAEILKPSAARRLPEPGRRDGPWPAAPHRIPVRSSG